VARRNPFHYLPTMEILIILLIATAGVAAVFVPIARGGD
jgi:hypothetical protein